MARTNLEFEYNGKEYKLAYTIEIVKRLDRMGFIAHLEERPLTITEDLFIAAFEANHSETSKFGYAERFTKSFPKRAMTDPCLKCLSK